MAPTKRELIERTRELEALNAVAMAIGRSLNLADVIREAIGQILAVTPADVCAVYLRDQISGDLVLQSIRGVSETFRQDPNITRMSAGVGWWGRMADEGKPITLPDAGALDRPSSEAVIREGLKSTAYVPLKVRGRINGAIVIASRERQQFGTQDVELLSAIGEQVGVAVENARLFEAEQTYARQLVLINEVSRQITATLEVDQVLEQVVTALHADFGYQLAAVLLLDAAGEALELRAIAGDLNGLPPPNGYRQPVSAGIMGRCVRTNQVVLVNDVSQDSDYIQVEDLEIGSELCMPIQIADQVAGVLNVESRQRNAFDQHDVIVMQTLADELSIALHNAQLFRRQRQQLAKLETLQEVARTISSLDLEEALDRILAGLKNVVAYDSAAVWLIREGELEVEAARRYDDAAPDMEVALPVDDALFQAARRTRRPVVLDDVREDPRFTAVGDTGYVRGWVCAPLVVRDHVIGCLTVDSSEVAAYGEEDAETIMTFARQAAVALENAQLHAQTKQQVGALEVLHTISVDLLRRRDLKDLLTNVVQRASHLVGATGGGLYLYDPEAGELTVTVSAGVAENYVGRKLKPGEGLAGRVIQTGEPMWVRDYETWKGRPAQYADAPFRASISVPLQYEDEVLGALSLSHVTPGRTFDRGDAELLTLLAAQAAVALENARLYGELSRLATHDGLTGLYNHRHFHELLEQEVSRAERYAHAVTLLMVDVDGFKDYNDQHGHVAGDEALRAIATILMGISRKSDLLARYGGEEFAIILPETPVPEAAEAAERLRQSIEEQTVHEPFLTPLTASVGVATYPNHADDAPGLLLAADKAMYEAKGRGKNQVARFSAG